MKKFLCLLLVVSLSVLCFAFTGCNKSTKDTMGVDENGDVVGTITIWGGSAPFHENYALGSIQGANYDPDCDSTVYLLNKIKAKYPKLNVVIESRGGSTTLNNNLRNAKISNNMPDIVVGEQFIQSQIDLGYFEPLTISQETKNAISDDLWSLSRGKDGKQYGYPAMTGTFALVYNKKIFKEVYDLTTDEQVAQKIPTTTDEIVQVAAHIKEFYNNKYGATSLKARSVSGFYLNTVSGVGSAYRNGLVMSMFGGGFQDENGDFIVNSEANVDAFKWLTSLIPYTSTGNIATNNETDVNSTILTGNVAMCFEIAPLLAPFQGLSVEDFGVAQLPTVEGKSTTNMLVGSTSYMITKDCSNKAVAQDILEMMVSYDMQKYLLTHSTNRIPVRKDVQTEALNSTDSAIVAKMKNLRPFVEALKTSEKIVTSLPSFSTNYSNIWATWTTAIQYIYTNASENTIRTQLGNVQTAMAGK